MAVKVGDIYRGTYDDDGKDFWYAEVVENSDLFRKKIGLVIIDGAYPEDIGFGLSIKMINQLENVTHWYNSPLYKLLRGVK